MDGVKASVAGAIVFVVFVLANALTARVTPSFAATPEGPSAIEAVPAPRPAARVTPASTPAAPTAIARPTEAVDAKAERARRTRAVKSWGYQLVGLSVTGAAAMPFDLLIVDPIAGLDGDRAMQRAEVERLKRKSDGGRRLILAHLAIGEVDDNRADIMAAEYLSEDAPDWLLHPNPRWGGSRFVRFCHDGWQRTLIGDDDGNNVHDTTEPSPLRRLVELGFDGVLLDRIEVYRDLAKECPDGERKMTEFVLRIAVQARRRDPLFMVMVQNGEELTRAAPFLEAVDAVVREDLFTGPDKTPTASQTAATIAHLERVRRAGKPVLVVDHTPTKDDAAQARKRIAERGFIPYVGPRDLAALWRQP